MNAEDTVALESKDKIKEEQSEYMLIV